MSNTTSKGQKGGLLSGNSHAKGGIKAIVTDTTQPVELEGGEIIINKKASKLHCETLSKINQSAGGGVPIPCDQSQVKEYYESGGQIGLFDAVDTTMENVKAGLEAALKYAEPEDAEKIQAHLESLNLPEPTPFELDSKIISLTEKYEDDIDQLLDFPISEQVKQRDNLLTWIKNPDKKVKVLIAFSGGKDSVAMVLKCIYEFKIPKTQIQLYHHDVDGEGEKLFDWPCTPSYCKAFADALGVDILFSYADGGIVKEMFRENTFRQDVYFQTEQNGKYHKAAARTWDSDRRTKLKWPAVANDLKIRWCSSVAKIEVMSRAINNNPELQKANICIMTGERRAESQNRSKYHEIERYRQIRHKTRKAITWRCVIDLSDKDVWELYSKYKIQPHPCYELGWGRCSCQICIFSNANIWASNNELDPKRIKRVADIEKDLKAKGSDMPNLYAKKATKKQIQAGQANEAGLISNGIYEDKVNPGKSFLDPDAVKRWKTEAMREFTSPIFVKDFKLPIGAYNSDQAGAN